MALGLKVLAVLVVAIFIAVAIVILPNYPPTAPAYNCFFKTKECMTNDPIELMSKLMPKMTYYGT